MMRALLDVNVLVALIDRKHESHARANRWLAENSATGWASCPLAENGCLRILTNPRYPSPADARHVLASLLAARSSPHFEFWPDDLTITDALTFDHQRLRGHQQVTDVYLLALAVQHGGRFVTFDASVAREIVPGARPEHLVVL